MSALVSPYHPLRVLFFGQSCVTDLANSGAEYLILSNGFKLQLHYYSIPGATIQEIVEASGYETFIENLRPDIIIIVLGGPELVYDLDLCNLNFQLIDLYERLQWLLGCKAILICDVEHSWTPVALSNPVASYPWINLESEQEWILLRNKINNKIRQAGHSEGICFTAGVHRLGRGRYFRPDGFRLNSGGINAFLVCVGRGIRHFIKTRNQCLRVIVLENYPVDWDGTIWDCSDAVGRSGVRVFYSKSAVNYRPSLTFEKPSVTESPSELGRYFTNKATRDCVVRLHLFLSQLNQQKEEERREQQRGTQRFRSLVRRVILRLRGLIIPGTSRD